MAITINIYYKGTGSAAKQFAKEMTESGTVDAIRKAEGNLHYEYFSLLDKELKDSAPAAEIMEGKLLNRASDKDIDALLKLL